MNIENIESPIQMLGIEQENHLYVKREDLIPLSFGGNKARKAALFWDEISRGDYDCVVTYGSSSSNHCRIISNIACSQKMPCYIISPEEASEDTYNSQMMRLFGAKMTTIPTCDVHDTINEIINQLKYMGKRPYFIPGGGHGNIGTQAYVNCYNEICAYELEKGVYFDYIYHASGTGTTQAGLVCGQLMREDKREIIGISIARTLPRGRKIVIDSVKEYLGDQYSQKKIEEKVCFLDKYTGGGYAKNTATEVIDDVLKRYGLPLDATYTGKAFRGMRQEIETNNIKGKNILFIHTGGTPLFFDYLEKERLVSR